jgi:hypothetical protein
LLIRWRDLFEIKLVQDVVRDAQQHADATLHNDFTVVAKSPANQFPDHFKFSSGSAGFFDQALAGRFGDGCTTAVHQCSDHLIRTATEPLAFHGDGLLQSVCDIFRNGAKSPAFASLQPRNSIPASSPTAYLRFLRVRWLTSAHEWIRALPA